MQFIIIHGSFGSPEGNWFPYLKQELEKLGQTVLAPQFPVDDYNAMIKAGPEAPALQTLENWLTALNKTLETVDKKDSLCIVSHSIGPVFTLHAVERLQLQLDSAIFVAPFLENDDLPDDIWPYQKVNSSFYRRDFNFEELRHQIPTSYVVYSPTDPFVDSRYPAEFAAKLNSSTVILKKGGHLNAEFGFTKFPLILEICKTRLS